MIFIERITFQITTTKTRIGFLFKSTLVIGKHKWQKGGCSFYMGNLIKAGKHSKMLVMYFLLFYLIVNCYSTIIKAPRMDVL